MGLSEEGREGLERLAVAGSLLREWIQLWSVATGKKMITLTGHKPCGVDSFAFRADNKTIISVGLQGKVKVWDVVTGKNIATLGGLTEEVNGNVVFFIRSGGHSNWGYQTGFGVEQLQKIVVAKPDEARKLASDQTWVLGQIPEKK